MLFNTINVSLSIWLFSMNSEALSQRRRQQPLAKALFDSI